MSQFKDDNKTGRYILWGALAVLAIIVFFSSFYTIRSTERGVNARLTSRRSRKNRPRLPCSTAAI